MTRRRRRLVRAARRRDPRRRRRRRQRPVGAARGAGRHAAARQRRNPRRRRSRCGPSSATRKRDARARRRPRARGPPARRPGHAVRGLRERDARLPRRTGLTAAACCSTAAPSSPTRRAKMEAFDIRPRAPLLRTANFSGGNQQKIVLAREIERDPRGHAGRPADARRRHRRDRVHPQAHRRRCATPARRCCWCRSSSTRSSRSSDRIVVLCGGRVTGERRPEETNAQDLGLLMAGVERARRMSAPLEAAARLGRRRADPADQRRAPPSSSPASSCWRSARTRSRRCSC